MDRRRELYRVLEAKRLKKFMPKAWYKSRTFIAQVAIVLLPWLGPLMKMPDAVWQGLISVLAAGTIGLKIGDTRSAARKIKEASLLGAALLLTGCATAQWNDSICPVDKADGIRKCQCNDGVVIEQHVRSARTEIKCGDYTVPVQMLGTVLPPKLMEPR